MIKVIFQRDHKVYLLYELAMICEEEYDHGNFHSVGTWEDYVIETPMNKDLTCHVCHKRNVTFFAIGREFDDYFHVDCFLEYFNRLQKIPNKERR